MGVVYHEITHNHLALFLAVAAEKAGAHLFVDDQAVGGVVARYEVVVGVEGLAVSEGGLHL